MTGINTRRNESTLKHMYTYTASSVSYWQRQCHRQQARDLSVQYDAWNPTKCRLLAINGCPTYHWCIYTDMCKSTWIWFLRTFHKLIQVKKKKFQRVTYIRNVFLCSRDYWSGEGHIVLPLSVRPFVTLSMHSLSG